MCKTFQKNFRQIQMSREYASYEKFWEKSRAVCVCRVNISFAIQQSTQIDENLEKIALILMKNFDNQKVTYGLYWLCKN